MITAFIRGVAATTLMLALVLAAGGAAHAQTGACCAGTLDVLAGSTMSLGPSGLLHDEDIAAGSVGFEIVSRCTDDQSACTTNADCGNQSCAATCDCNADTTCEITGPTQPTRCQTTLDTCTTNADCTATTCSAPFAPPLPLNADGSPLCLLAFHDRPIEGTFNSATGDLSVRLGLRARIMLGEAPTRPCPQCGLPNQDPVIGGQFTCTGGTNDGEACTVDAVTELYGGTSYDCPPEPSASVNGSGVTLPIHELTTGTTTRTASRPCTAIGLNKNPLNPASQPKCTDKQTTGDPVCTSNADCLRCSGDPTISCTTNANCTGAGSCAAAPDQPVTCGYWCHCGFCEGDPNEPCFDDSECTEGESCDVGSGSTSTTSGPQQRPNGCGSPDAFICGMAETEECKNAKLGSCSLASFRSCDSNSDCEDFAAGTCELEPLSCFEPRITRTGDPSPLGSYCEIARTTCTNNGDCAGPGDECLRDTANPEAVALMCVPGGGAVNLLLGGAGPASIELEARIAIERCGGGGDPVCGDGNVEGTEACDDGNATFTAGEHCGVDCVRIPCGKPTNSSGELPKSSDALFVLRAAVEQSQCDVEVCDADGNGTVVATDALRILRKAVQQPVELLCPA